MAILQDIEFEIVRQTDKRLLSSCRELAKNGTFNWSNGSLTLRTGITVPVSPDSSSKKELLDKILEKNSELCSSFQFPIADNFSVTITRPKDKLFDTVKIYCGSGRQQVQVSEVTVIELEASLRKKLRALGAKQSISAILGKELKSYYEARESELSRLESIVVDAQKRVLASSLESQRRLDDSFQEKRLELEAELKERAAQLEERADAREADLEKREKVLEERLKDLDDRANRHARRGIRKDLKKEFEKRSSEFQLTEGTQKLRGSIWWFTVVLIALFGLGFVVSTWFSFQALADLSKVSSTALTLIIVRQVLLGLAFGGTSIFFVRWNNRWFEQHASEEFKLKRMEIDFDRASWLVEMALEWKDEKGSEIPARLLDGLSKNLFQDQHDDHSDLHPVDQLASALLGSSSGLKLTLPGGIGTLDIDRKGIKQLEKQKNPDR